MAGMLVHDLDFVCSLLGEPESVCAEVRTSEPVHHLPDGETIEITADDTAALLLRMESGVVAVLSVSVIGAHADHYRLELFVLRERSSATEPCAAPTTGSVRPVTTRSLRCRSPTANARTRRTCPMAWQGMRVAPWR